MFTHTSIQQQQALNLRHLATRSFSLLREPQTKQHRRSLVSMSEFCGAQVPIRADETPSRLSKNYDSPTLPASSTSLGRSGWTASNGNLGRLKCSPPPSQLPKSWAGSAQFIRRADRTRWWRLRPSTAVVSSSTGSLAPEVLSPRRPTRGATSLSTPQCPTRKSQRYPSIAFCPRPTIPSRAKLGALGPETSRCLNTVALPSCAGAPTRFDKCGIAICGRPG